MHYALIYADPPWNYKVWGESKNKSRNASEHYNTMDIESIARLSVADISATDSALLMWCTSPCLKEALYVIEKWGFKYKTELFIWTKVYAKTRAEYYGLGHYSRASVEKIIIATKGKGISRVDKGVNQWIEDYEYAPETLRFPVYEHSKKPEEAYKRIEKLFGDVSRIELFARNRRIGWDAIGNDVDGMDIVDSIELAKIASQFGWSQPITMDKKKEYTQLSMDMEIE